MFQFHKVRLKASESVDSLIEVVAFQFHKVRLKDRTWNCAGRIDCVSIP